MGQDQSEATKTALDRTQMRNVLKSMELFFFEGESDIVAEWVAL